MLESNDINEASPTQLAAEITKITPVCIQINVLSFTKYLSR